VESSSFSFRGRAVEVYRFVADLGAYGLKIKDGAVDVGIPGYGMEVHTYVKDVSAALLVALGKAPPSSIATEVTLPSDVGGALPLSGGLRDGVAELLGLKKPTGVRLKLEEDRSRADILGVAGDSLLIGEAKAWGQVPEAKSFGNYFAAIDAWGRAAGDYVSVLVDAFNGRPLGGEGAYSAFAWPGPMPPVPDLRGPYLFAYAKYKVVGGKIEVYVVFVEATRAELADVSFLKRLDAEAKDAVEAVGSWESVGRLGDLLADRLAAAGGALGELAAQLLRTGGYTTAT